jgi:chromosome segregation ATPase
MGKSRDTLFDWMVRRAEADLGVAQALVAGEMQRAHQIKHLETTLIGQINKLQHQVIESHEAELNDLKSEIFACADRIAQFEGTQSTVDAARRVIQELDDLRAQLSARQTELEIRCSGFETLGESLATHIRGLQEELRDKLDSIKTAQVEMCHFQSETHSLAERVAQAESDTWQARTLILHNTQQLEQTTESIKSDIVALNALFTDIKDNQRNLPLLDTLFKELARNLGAKIEEIDDRLAHSHNSQLECDARLGQLDSGLAMLAERLTRTESLSNQIHALTHAEVSAASEFRENTLRQLSSLEARLSDSTADHGALQELTLSLSAQVQASQQQAAQQFTLLDSRDAAQERNAKELAAFLAAKLTQQDEKLGPLANVHKELYRLAPEVQILEQRINQTDLALQRAQDRTDDSARRIGQLEESLKSEIVALNAAVAKLAEQQTLRLPEDQLREIKHELDVKVAELQRQLGVERDGFDHWGKGLRESFGAELSAMQARLSERLSQIEHRYARLERSEETVKANFDGLEAQLKETLQLKSNHYEQWGRFQSRLGTLDERTSKLETQVRHAEDRAVATAQKTEQSVDVLRCEIRTVQTLFDPQALPSADSILRGIEETLGAKFQEIEERFTKQLCEYDSCNTERRRDANKLFETLQSELAAIRTEIVLRADKPSEPSLRGVEEFIATKMQEFQQPLAQKLILLEKCDAERTHQIEQMIAGFKTEMAALDTELIQRPTRISSTDPALRGLEENLSAKIEELRQQMAQKFRACDSHESDLEELKERSQSLIGRMIELSAAIQSSQDTVVLAAQPVAPKPEVSPPRTPAEKIEGEDSPTEIQARSEKEQLIKLQERMSAEIERVRTELKERSGRWKVRKSAAS